MALTGTQYQSMRLKFRGLISNPYWFVSEPELDSFISQLAIDATGTLAAAQKTQADTLLQNLLSSPAYTPVAGDVALLFATMIAAAPLVIGALVPARYQQLKNALTGALSMAGIANESQMLAYVYANTANPPAIITSGGALNAWFRGDTVVQSGGFVSQWTDKIGNSLNHLVQATGSLQPAFTASDATLNNQPTMLGDGVDDYMTAAGMTVGAVYWIGAVLKQVTWVLNARLIQSSTSAATKAGITQSGGGSPSLSQFEAGVGGNGPSIAAAVGAWKYVEWASNNTTSDFLHVGADVQTGVASGRTASSTQFFAFSDGAHLASCAIAEIIVANYIPTLTERNNIKAYVAARYIASLIT